MSDYSVQSFMNNLPAPIEKSEHLNQLAEVAARIFQTYVPKLRLPAVNSDIDSMDEELLDIMARDYKVDWYDYNANVETKRRTIENNWYVHKRLGSVRAVERALAGVWADTFVEEWFEYGGSPYYFRVILDASENMNPIRMDYTLKYLHIYKPVRAWLEENMPIVRVSFRIVIKTSKLSHKYHARPVGTKPRWARHGNIDDDPIIIETESGSQKYHPPLTGMLNAGTHPNTATHADIDDGGLIIGVSSEGAQYRARPCGTPLTSLM